MKRLVIIFILFITSAALSHAQYSYPSKLESRGSTVYADGEKLTSQEASLIFSDFGGSQMGAGYLKDRKNYRTGVALSIAGSSLIAAGSFSFYTGSFTGMSQEHGVLADVLTYAGAGVVISGVIMSIKGIPTAVIHRKHIKKATAEYNSAVASKPLVTFAPARSGIGIAMSF